MQKTTFGHCNVHHYTPGRPQPGSLMVMKKEKGHSSQQPLTKKVFRVMKLTTILLLATLLQASARSHAQTVTYTAKAAPLQEVLAAIRQQTGKVFFFDNRDLADTKPVTVTLEKQPFEKALDLVLQGQGLTWQTEGNTVVIVRDISQKQASTATFFTPPVAAHDLRVHITDSLGSPLQGASVVVKATKQGGQTDAEGNITLAGLNGEETLVISYVGYETKEVNAGDNTTLTIVLNATPAALDEVQLVSKGYYATTRTLNTGNVTTVQAVDIERQPVSDPILALQGRVPGLFIQQQSGIAGREEKIQLRGINSIANGTSPLFIVDGIQFSAATPSQYQVSAPAGGNASPFNYINPADIERIDVLKDADATAIYGSRGANGVILITTKKGKEGKTRVDFNIYTGVGKMVQRMDFMNTQQYLAMRRQAFANDNATPGPSDYDLNGTWDTTRNTNWQDYFFGGAAPVTEASAAVSGGSRYTQFRLAGTYRNEGTVYPGDFSARRASIQFNANHSSANERFTIALSSFYTYSLNNLPNGYLSQNIDQGILLAPDAPKLYNDDGSLNWANSTWTNPMSGFQATADEVTRNLVSNLVISYKLFKGLELKSSFGYTIQDFKQTNLTPLTAYNPAYSYPSLRTNQFLTNQRNSWNIEPQLTYQQHVLGGDLEALVGLTFQSDNVDYLGVSGSGFSNDEMIKSFAAAPYVQTLTSSNTAYRYNALYARVGYDYRERYTLNITARRDGSSRFGPGNKFGNFGAVGAGWIFSNEEWAKEKASWLSFGKIRASVGTTGNDQLTDYKYLDTYSTLSGGAYQGVTGLVPTQLTNPYYGWERVNKTEVALELGFLGDKLTLNTSLYRNRTRNQLVQYGLPSVAGFTSVMANLPAVIENKGLEMDMSTVNIQTKHFTWTTRANITFPKNKLVSYPNIEASSYATRYIVGQPLTLSNLYHYTGLDPATGLYTFQDFDGNGLTSLDQRLVFVGQRYYGGIENNFKFYRFELDFLVQFTKQNGFEYFTNVPPGFFNGGLPNQIILTDKKRPTPPLSQSFDNLIQYSKFVSSDGVLSDASFLKLKNVSLSWQVPLPDNFKKVLKTASIYFQGQNLLTISRYIGFDPEVQGQTPYPGVAPLRTLTFGLRASF